MTFTRSSWQIRHVSRAVHTVLGTTQQLLRNSIGTKERTHKRAVAVGVMRMLTNASWHDIAIHAGYKSNRHSGAMRARERWRKLPTATQDLYLREVLTELKQIDFSIDAGLTI